MGTIFFIFACYGLTTIIVQSKIFKPVRRYVYQHNYYFLNGLLTCMMCTGFWIGLFASMFFHYSPSYTMLNGTGHMLPYNFFDGAFTSGCIWLIYLIQLNLERHVGDEL